MARQQGSGVPQLHSIEAVMVAYRWAVPKGYEGSTLNGHLILSGTDVQEWFESVGHVAPPGAALAIAKLINQYEFLGAHWKEWEDLREWRRNNPSRLRAARIAAAVQTLKADLPAAIAETREVAAKEKLGELEPVIELLDLTKELAPRFSQFLPHQGREKERWHAVATKVGAEIVKTLSATTGRRAGLGKQTSPAVKILQLALGYLGTDKSPAAIVEAVRPKRKRLRKRVG